MLNLPVYLYPNIYSVLLDLDPTTLGVNRVMYQRDLEIQKGVKNTIRIQFKNSDQKRLPIDINTRLFKFTMYDEINQRLMLEKDLTILDDTLTVSPYVAQTIPSKEIQFTSTDAISPGQSVAGFGIQPNTIIGSISTGNTATLNVPTLYALDTSTQLTVGSLCLRGTAELVLTEQDLVDLDKSSYHFAIIEANTSTRAYIGPAYSNTYYKINGTIHLRDDIYPKLQPSQEIIFGAPSFNADSTIQWPIGCYEYKRENIYSHPEFCNIRSVHTAAFYMTGYRGTIYTLATLSNTPASFGDYTVIDTRVYDDQNPFTGIDYVNFEGVYTYVAFMHVPSATPPFVSNNPNDPGAAAWQGTVDKILYRA